MQDSFGERLKQLRKNAGLTQTDIGNRLNKSASAVRMWELGVNEPGFDILVRLSMIFDCSLDYLLCRDLYMRDAGAVRTNVPVFRLSTYGADTAPEQFKSIPSDYLRSGNTYFMLLNDSRSMEPVLPYDAFVLITRQDACMDGQIVFFRYKNDYLLRKLQFCNGGIIFTGSLLDSTPVFVESDDTSLEILGVVAEYTKIL